MFLLRPPPRKEWEQALKLMLSPMVLIILTPDSNDFPLDLPQ